MSGQYEIEVRTWQALKVSEAELMTMTEAADYLDLSAQAVGTLARTGKLRLVVDRAAPNPQHAQRLLKADVQAYRRERRKRT